MIGLALNTGPDLAAVAEAGRAALNAMHPAAGAVSLSGKVHRICVEHRLGDLDES